jgi:hypothetical protein
MNPSWRNHLKGDPLPWLLESNKHTKYRTLVDLLDKEQNSVEVASVKQDLMSDPKLIRLLQETENWFPQSITRHNDPKICFFKLRMLADFGLNKEDPGMRDLVDMVTARRVEGMYASRQTLPEKGIRLIIPNQKANEWHAMPCDTPLITYTLLQMGVRDQTINQAVEAIKEKWDTQSGWFCHFFFLEKQFQKLKCSCPMAGLMALEVFSQIPELKESQYAKNAYQPLKFHKEYGKPIYFFGRGQKFWTLKYPFIWYNALYLADVLTRFDFLKDDPLVGGLIQWIEESQNEKGSFAAEAIHKEYRGWDFAEKNTPSPWITLLCCRILKRWYG